MPVDIKERGYFECFESPEGNRLIVFNDRGWNTWIEGELGEVLVHTNSEHTKKRELMSGDFLLVRFHNDSRFEDGNHLFLQDEGAFRHYMVPKGLPAESNQRRRIVESEQRVDARDLVDYLKAPEPHDARAAEREEPEEPGEGDKVRVTYYAEKLDYPVTTGEILDNAHKRNAPSDVIHDLETLPEDMRFEDLNAVKEAFQDKKREQREPPISNYADLSANEALKRLDTLDEDSLREIREWERDHQNRSTVLESIDRKLGRPTTG